MTNRECQCSLVDPEVSCKNEKTTTRKINFGQWKVTVELCTPHAELWDSKEEQAYIVKIYHGKKPS